MMRVLFVPPITISPKFPNDTLKKSDNNADVDDDDNDDDDDAVGVDEDERREVSSVTE